MSSPSRNRSVLSPRQSNVSSPSPKKNKVENPFNTKVNLTYNPVKASPSSKKPKLAFTIYEDKIPHTTSEQSVEPISNKLNHSDQENILQPKKETRSEQGRSPLANLNIYKFPGYVSYDPNSNLRNQLIDLYQPSNSENEFKSLHKHLSLPSYLTPPRSSRHKYLVSSKEDDLELHLIKRSNSIRHRRSHSVGKNLSKLNLIRKNTFDILTT